MKHRFELFFLAGALLPLVLATAFHKLPPAPEAAQTTVPTTVPTTQPRRARDPETVLTIETRDGRLLEMDLREYLVGVVLAEMPADFEPEALKAQAVVARTYARKRMERSKHSPADLCADPGCCQGWKSEESYLAAGGRSSSVEKVRTAVTDTDGYILEYGGTLIDATYFSCSGGTTEDAVAVWGQDVPYLQSVESPGEEGAPRFSDAVSFTAREFAEKLELSPSGDPADWFGEVTYTDGGGVDTMVIRGKVFPGTGLRSRLNLRSTAFEITVSGDTITVATRGFGHRVGMSQYGAQAMAESGSTFAEILTHYYTGAELVRENYGN